MSNETMINNTELFTPEPMEIVDTLPATTTTGLCSSGGGKFALGLGIGGGVTTLIFKVFIPLGQKIHTTRQQKKAEKEQEVQHLKDGVDVEVVDDGKGKKK